MTHNLNHFNEVIMIQNPKKKKKNKNQKEKSLTSTSFFFPTCCSLHLGQHFQFSELFLPYQFSPFPSKYLLKLILSTKSTDVSKIRMQ